MMASKGHPKGQARSASRKQAQPSTSFWESLSPERRLDVIGIILAILGILILLTLFASSRSAITGGILSILSRLLGWGVYVLPVGLIVFGLWLILRKIERIPANTGTLPADPGDEPYIGRTPTRGALQAGGYYNIR